MCVCVCVCERERERNAEAQVEACVRMQVVSPEASAGVCSWYDSACCAACLPRIPFPESSSSQGNFPCFNRSLSLCLSLFWMMLLVVILLVGFCDFLLWWSYGEDGRCFLEVSVSSLGGFI
eukprot:TRINITY_DN7327_c0_g2_i2.p1 TRINITY_DN7327_c0_g2~~TRINITY_DN7327_c0_g2_i2.p1  ORF type:complete len:121 (-),score=18.79 TRINITY_DN7327_c0_g2_i2:171-533(-)